MTPEETTPRRVLVIGSEAPALTTVIPLLQRAHFDVSLQADRLEAIDRVRSETFHLLIAGYPLRNIPFRSLLEAVRAKGAPCRNAGLLVVAEELAFEEAEGFLGRGVNRVVREKWAAHRLLLAVADLIGESPRISLRSVVQLEVRAGKERELSLFQTENVSVSGMLVRNERQLPIGTTLTFELTVPGHDEPIRGVGEVIRHTDAERERVTGFAVRFTGFATGGREALEAFIAGCPR
ncbi:MAG: PilZ domain-containing protein [Acidobacteriota bacterium]